MTNRLILAALVTVVLSVNYCIWLMQDPEPDTFVWMYGITIGLWVCCLLRIFWKYLRLGYILISGYIKYHFQKNR